MKSYKLAVIFYLLSHYFNAMYASKICTDQEHLNYLAALRFSEDLDYLEALEESRFSYAFETQEKTNEKGSRDFLDQKLTDNSISYFPHKSWVETSEYYDCSKIYSFTEYCSYPKMPRIHGYDHTAQETYLSLQFPREIIHKMPSYLLTSIFRDVPKENIDVFILAQNSHENDSLLRPHYYTDNEVLMPTYNQGRNITVGLFSLNQKTLVFEEKPEGTMLNTSISTHPSGDGESIASPCNLKIHSFNKKEGGFFASLVITQDIKKREALTFHIVPAQQELENFQYFINNSITIANLMKNPQISKLMDLESVMEIIAKKIKY